MYFSLKYILFPGFDHGQVQGGSCFTENDYAGSLGSIPSGRQKNLGYIDKWSSPRFFEEGECHSLELGLYCAKYKYTIILNSCVHRYKEFLNYAKTYS